jgi:hypothetical protein
MSLLDEITPLLITYNEIQNIERTSANMLVLPEGDQSAARYASGGGRGIDS